MENFTRNISFNEEKNEYTVNLNLSQKLNKDGKDVTCGYFVGNKGFNISTISGKSKNEYKKQHENDELGFLKLHVENVGEDYILSWNLLEGCSDVEKFNEFLLKEIEFCENKIANPPQKTKKSTPVKSNPGKSRKEPNKQYYEFHVKVASRFIGKMIGVEGSNIKELKESINKKLNLERFPRVSVKDTGHAKSDSFTLTCKNKDCVNDTDEGIWLVVQYIGNKGYKEVYSCCQRFVNQTMKNYEEEEEEDVEEEFDDVVEDNPEENNGW